jgi:hypothetical protein
LPELVAELASKANRAGVAARFPDPAVPQPSAVDLALITYDDELVRDLALSLTQTAKHHDAHPWYLVQTVPGMGQNLSLVVLDDIHQSERFPRVQDFASSGRLLQGAQEAGGTRVGTSGQQIGHAHLQWAFSAAAALFLRQNEPGPKRLARVENKHDPGTALSLLAHTRGRAVSDRLKRQGAVDLDILLRAEGSRAGEPGASLDTHGDEPVESTLDVRLDGVCERHGVPRLGIPEPGALFGHPLWLRERRRGSHQLACAAPPPSLRLTGEPQMLSQPFA